MKDFFATPRSPTSLILRSKVLGIFGDRQIVWSFITPPEVANTGTRFLTGGPGAAPGGVASKNGWVYMRVQGGFDLHRRESLSVCVSVCVSLNDSWSVEKWLARKVARLPRRVAESTPRPKGRWVCEARRHALPVCGSDNPRHLNVSTAHPVGVRI